MNESIGQSKETDDEEEIRSFVQERIEARKRNEILPWNEDPLFKDFPLYEGPVPADFVERHDDCLTESENALLPASEDPLFKGHEIYNGPAPADLSERHDDYLYGDDEKS